jgi:viroplasmin and RNaseH domain-containing protein
MEKKGVEDYIKIIKPVSAETTLVRGMKAYYAVANGRSPGIQEWYL